MPKQQSRMSMGWRQSPKLPAKLKVSYYNPLPSDIQVYAHSIAPHNTLYAKPRQISWKHVKVPSDQVATWQPTLC